MSTHKTIIDQYQVERFLQKHLALHNISTELMSDGESSEAFAFEDGDGRSLVIRISKHGKHGFVKDWFAHTNFVSDDLPIPTILEIGEMEEGLQYAITARALGKTLDKFSGPEIEALMPKILHTLDTIHAISPAGEGYGQWNEHGQGKYSTWREDQIASLHQDDEETKGASFYDTKLHDELRDEAMKLADYATDERKLVHGDFGFNNVVSDGKDITGVLDWEMSMYGDSLYDIAWLDFWDTNRDYQNIFKKHYKKQGRLPINYDTRVLVCKLQIGLGSLGFFARSRQRDKYEFARNVVANFLGAKFHI